MQIHTNDDYLRRKLKGNKRVYFRILGCFTVCIEIRVIPALITDKEIPVHFVFFFFWLLFYRNTECLI